LPDVHVDEQHCAAVVHASPFDVQAAAAATHFPPSQRFEQHSDGFVQLAPAAAAFAHAMPVEPPPPSVPLPPSAGGAISLDSLPQLADANVVATTVRSTQGRAHETLFMIRS
jgi:hypothetical protein